MGVHPEILSTLLYAGENVIIRLGERRGEENIIMKDSNREKASSRVPSRQYFVLICMLDTHITGDTRTSSCVHAVYCVHVQWGEWRLEWETTRPGKSLTLHQVNKVIIPSKVIPTGSSPERSSPQGHPQQGHPQTELPGRSPHKHTLLFHSVHLTGALSRQGLPWVTAATWACEPQTRLPVKCTLEFILLSMLTI